VRHSRGRLDSVTSTLAGGIAVTVTITAAMSGSKDEPDPT
jgi:hypothetical protein